jgi:hypothetical protein
MNDPGDLFIGLCELMVVVVSLQSEYLVVFKVGRAVYVQVERDRGQHDNSAQQEECKDGQDSDEPSASHGSCVRTALVGARAKLPLGMKTKNRRYH